MNTWRTFLLWLLISLAATVLLIIVFHTLIVVAFLLIPVGFFLSHRRSRRRDLLPTDEDRSIRPR